MSERMSAAIEPYLFREDKGFPNAFHAKHYMLHTLLAHDLYMGTGWMADMMYVSLHVSTLDPSQTLPDSREPHIIAWTGRQPSS